MMMTTTRRAWTSLATLAGVATLVIASACAVLAKKPDKEERMLEEGLALLERKDSASICKGADMLARSGRAEAIEPLLGHLRTRDEAARECVREALGKLDVAPVLVGQWRSEDAALKERALERAVALPHPGLMVIHTEAASDPDPKRRKRVATGLRRQAEGPEVWGLLAALVADPDHDVRWWAIDTLGLSRSPEAGRILRERLGKEPDAALETFIRRALGEAE